MATKSMDFKLGNDWYRIVKRTSNNTYLFTKNSTVIDKHHWMSAYKESTGIRA